MPSFTSYVVNVQHQTGENNTADGELPQGYGWSLFLAVLEGPMVPPLGSKREDVGACVRVINSKEE